MADIKITMKNIGKVFETDDVETHALKDVNFEIHAGDYVSISGPSGCGKSTLLSILGLLDMPSSGSYSIEGIDVSALSLEQAAAMRNEKIGFVFQSFHLLPRLSAIDNIMLPLEILGDKQAREKSMNALSQMGLEKRALHLPNQLSGGEKQRVAIARAMVKEPTILFADEPTGNLDKNSTGKISNLLLDINRSFGTTIVIVTHDLALAEKGKTMHELNEGELV